MERLQPLLDVIAAAHFPEPGASEELLQACELRLNAALPSDLRDFYRFANGARLFDKIDSPYRIMPLSKLCHPSVVILGEDCRPEGTEGFVAFCDVRDGNYLAIDLKQCTAESGASSQCPIIDCFHETFPDPAYLEVIANSFSEFLSYSLTSGGGEFWLEDEFRKRLRRG